MFLKILSITKFFNIGREWSLLSMLHENAISNLGISHPVPAQALQPRKSSANGNVKCIVHVLSLEN